MWLQEPGSFTNIIAAIVAPRNTSSETMRPGRGESAATKDLGAGAEMACAVAMVRSSNGGDSTAAQGLPQRCKVKPVYKKTRPGKGFPATNFARGKKLSRSSGADCSFVRGLSATADSRLKSIDRPHCARRRKLN